MASTTARYSVSAVAVIVVLIAGFAQRSSAETHYYDWTIENATFTKDCHTVTVPTVNGQLPGPTIEVTEGDTLVIKVTNKQVHPVTLHWHGLRQFGTNYADGPAYITQCPIQQGNSFTYEFTVNDNRGTFWYHAHISWLRATVHGALIIHPKKTPPYGAVEAEIPIVLGEWFGIPPNQYEQVFINAVMPTENITTITPTVNGNPGPKYGCSKGATTTYKLKPNKTYLLRLINAAMNNNYYFRVGGHKVTVVGADGNYLEPFRTNLVAFTPGQTTNVLLITSKTKGKYYFGFDVGPIPLGIGFPPPSISALGLFEYTNSPASFTPIVPSFPKNLTLKPMDKYVAKLKGHGPYTLPKTLDQDLIYTSNVALTACFPSERCATGIKVAGTIQNTTFDEPTTTSILEAYATGANGVYENNFGPDKPPSLNIRLDIQDPNYLNCKRGTKTKTFHYNDTVQIVIQNVFAAGLLDHPFHLHGHDFYVVGRGYGIYDPAKDQANFNLVNPPLFNTFALPNGGWFAMRFRADNPGVWLMHCHFERHKTWGMMTVFITENGGGHVLEPPLHPMPSCAA